MKIIDHILTSQDEPAAKKIFNHQHFHPRLITQRMKDCLKNLRILSKPEDIKSLARSKHKREDDIKMDLNVLVMSVWTGLRMVSGGGLF
jgi:hypothetical protein